MRIKILNHRNLKFKFYKKIKLYFVIYIVAVEYNIELRPTFIISYVILDLETREILFINM